MPADIASFYSKTRAARKIIVVDLGFLGDTIHLLPALKEIKRNYPEAALHVLTTPVGCEVLSMASWIDRGWAVEMSKQKRTLRQQWQVIRAVRSEGFDLAFNFSAADRALFVTALTGAGWKIAYSGRRSHFWKQWLVRNWMDIPASSEPAYERRRQMLAACGLQLDEPKFDFAPSQAARDWVADNVTEGAIHFSINASTHLKEWPLEHWIRLAKLIWRDRPGTGIVATASSKPRELERLKTFAQALTAGPLETFADLPIAQLAALLERCSLHVGADSGVLHIAMASRVPTVSLFREYSGMQAWLPRGPQHSSLTVSCACSQQRPEACLQFQNARCLMGLTPERVLEAVSERLRVAV